MKHGLHKNSQGRRPIDVGGLVSVVGTLAASVVWAAGCGPPVPGAVQTTEIEQHIVAGAVADDAGVYVVTGGLVADTGRLHAFDPAGAPSWSLELASKGTAPLLGLDDQIYVGLRSSVVAFGRDGRPTSYVGERSGQLAWHPSGGLVVFGPGLSLLDEGGAVVAERTDDFEPVAVAIAGDGRIFALGQPIGAPVAVLVAFSVNLVERWRITLATQAGSGLAVDETRVIARTIDGGVFALDHDGNALWSVVGATGSGLLIDDDGTVIVGNATIDADGAPTNWPTGGTFTLVAGVLSGFGGVVDDGGGITMQLGTFDARSGAPLFASVVAGATELFPTAARGSVFGAAHFIEQGSFIDDEGITAQQTAHAFSHVLAIPADLLRSTTAAPWPTTTGDGGRRALPATLVRPEPPELLGTWVALDGFRARVIELSSSASAFGISVPAYGLYDYDVREAVRLVQVGTWTSDGETIALSPTEDLTGGAARTTLNLSPGTPGTLRIDDPLEDAVHTYRRRAALPSLQAAGRGAPGLDIRYALGAVDFDTVSLTAPAGDDDVWVLSAFDFHADIGGRSLNVEVSVDPVTGETLFGGGVALWRLGRDRVKNLLQLNNRGTVVTMTSSARSDGPVVRLYGGLATERDGPRFTWVEYAPAQDSLVVVGHGDVVPEEALTGLPGFGAVFGDGACVDLRRDFDLQVRLTGFDAAGGLVWSKVLPADAAAFIPQGLVALDDDRVALLFERSGTLVIDDVTLRLGHTPTSAVLVFDRRTGKALAGKALGGRLETPVLATAPGGRLVIAGPVADRFTAGGPVVVVDEAGKPLVLAVIEGPDGGFAPIAQRTLPTATLPTNQVATTIADALITRPSGLILMSGLWQVPVTRQGGDVVITRPVKQTLEAFDPCGRSVWRRTTPVVGGRFSAGTDDIVTLGGGFVADFFEKDRGYRFSGGSVDLASGTGGPDAIVVQIPVDDDVLGGAPAVCATPARPDVGTLTVTVSGLGQGRVVSDPPGIDCPGRCSMTAPMLTEVVLVATPVAGASVDGFVGDLDHDGQTAYARVIGDSAVTVGFSNTRLQTTVPVTSTRLLRPDVASVGGGDGALVVVRRDEAGATIDGVSVPANLTGPLVLRLDPVHGVTSILGIPLAGADAGIVDVVALQDGAVAVLGDDRLLRGQGAGVFGQDLALVVIEQDGAIRFSRSLPGAGNLLGALTLTPDGDLVALWARDTPTRVDGVDVSPGRDGGILARLSPVDGSARVAVTIGRLPLNAGETTLQLRPTDDGGVDLIGSGFGFSPTTIVPGAVMQAGFDGAWGLRLDAQLSFSAFRQWRSFDPAWPSAFGATDGSVSPSSVYAVGFLDDALVPAWGAQIPRTGYPAYIPADAEIALRGLSASTFADVVVDPATLVTPVVVVDTSARPTAAWVAPELSVPIDHAIAVPGGIWAASTGAVFFLARSEVRR